MGKCKNLTNKVFPGVYVYYTVAFCWQIPAQKRKMRDSRMGRSFPPHTAVTSLYPYSALYWHKTTSIQPRGWLYVCICCSFSLIPNVQSLNFRRQIEGQASLSWGQLETAGTGYNASSNVADELNYRQNALPRATISQNPLFCSRRNIVK